MEEPVDVCEKGYFCKLSSNSSNPVDDLDGNFGPCPPGLVDKKNL